MRDCQIFSWLLKLFSALLDCVIHHHVYDSEQHNEQEHTPDCLRARGGRSSFSAPCRLISRHIVPMLANGFVATVLGASRLIAVPRMFIIEGLILRQLTTRRAVVLALFSLAGCSEKTLEQSIPAQAGEWRRTEMAPLEPTAAPEIVRQLGLKRAATATYTAAGNVSVRVFEMNAPTSAFEMIQKWRQQDGLAVYSGPFFIVADPNSGPQASDVLAALRRQLDTR